MLKNKAELVKQIEDIVKKDSVSYIDALLHYCNQNGIEPEYAGELIKNTPLKAKLESDAQRYNFLAR